MTVCLVDLEEDDCKTKYYSERLTLITVLMYKVNKRWLKYLSKHHAVIHLNNSSEPIPYLSYSVQPSVHIMLNDMITVDSVYNWFNSIVFFKCIYKFIKCCIKDGWKVLKESGLNGTSSHGPQSETWISCNRTGSCLMKTLKVWFLQWIQWLQWVVRWHLPG